MAEYRGKPTWALLLGSDLPEGSEDKVLKMLGSVVSDFEHPLQDIIWRKTKDKEQELATVMKVVDEDFRSMVAGYRNDGVRLRLTEVIRAKLGSGECNSQDISSKTVITRTLENHRQYFEEIRSQFGSDILTMIKDNPKPDTPYALMIVGIKTCIDSKISLMSQVFSNVEAGATIPIDAALKAAGIPVPINTNIDISTLRDKFAKLFTQFSAKGERVFAIQYRRIHRKTWHKSTRYGDLHTVSPNSGLFTGDERAADQLDLGPGLDESLSKSGKVYVMDL